MVIKIPEGALSLVHMVGTDCTRAALCGILFDKKHEELVATNGHILGIFPYNDVKELKNNIIVPASVLRNIKGHIYLLEREDGYYIGARHIGEADSTELERLNTYHTLRPFKPIDVKYPDYKNLFDEKEPMVYRVCLGAEVVLQLIRAVGQKKNPGIVLEFGKKGTGHIKFYSRSKGVNGILMPQRIPDGMLFDDTRIGLLSESS